MRTVELMLAGIFIMVLQVDVVRKIYARQQMPFQISEADNMLVIIKNKGLKRFRFWWVFFLITFYVVYFHYAASKYLHDSANREPFFVSTSLLWSIALLIVGFHYTRFRRNVDIILQRTGEQGIMINRKYQFIPGCGDAICVNVRGTIRGLARYSISLRTGKEEMLIADGLSEAEMTQLRTRIRCFLTAVHSNASLSACSSA